MPQTTRERAQEQTSQTSDEDMVEVWVNVHQTDIAVVKVKRGATLSDVLEAIQAFYVTLGETFDFAGSQILFNDRMYTIGTDGTIQGDMSYAIFESATFTLTRRVSGGMLS